ncbi:MAG: prepilin-type N-terminal cleavage/methylation domain-containing protein [Acidimicrobiales bacterium]|jgi:Tfp pilus assembly protein PilE
MTLPRRPDEAGFTLVETALTVLIVAIVLAAAFPVVPVFFRESTAVQNTYTAVDQLVLASEVATRFIHEAVDPSPTSTTFPFLSASANAATFYTNDGNANGPEKVVVSVSNGVGGTRTFTADIYVPTAGTCPFAANPTSTCVYTSATRSILLINYLTNGTGGSPVFTYTLQGGGSCGGPPPGTGGTTLKSALSTGGPVTTLSVNSLTTAVAGSDTLVIGTGSTAQTVTAGSAGASVGATSIPVNSFTPTSNFAAGTSVYDQSCSATQVSEISAVSLSLQATKSPGGQPTGYQTMAYLFSPNYSSAVG